LIAAAGIDTCVAGSAIFGAPDEDGYYRRVVGALRREPDSPQAYRRAA